MNKQKKCPKCETGTMRLTKRKPRNRRYKDGSICITCGIAGIKHKYWKNWVVGNVHDLLK